MRWTLAGLVVLIGLGVGLLLWTDRAEPPSPVPLGPNIVFITIDTLRADRLQVYGHDRNTSPHLAELAERGVVFDQAIAQAPWTLPSLATLHTGLYPRQHGAVRYETRLSDDALTVAEAMKKLGYATAAIVAHRPANRRHGFGQGFDFFDESSIRGHRAKTSGKVSKRAIEQLREFGRDKPFFLWLHYFDPHESYMRHRRYGYADEYMNDRFPKKGIDAPKDKHDALDADLRRTFVDYALAVYDEEIAFTDEWIGRVVEELKRLNAFDNTVFVVTSDHGELFSEHGRFAHGKDTYEELVRVPLIIAGAIDDALKGSVVKERVELAMVPATILTLAGDAEPPFRGPDLLSVARGDATVPVVFTQGLIGRSAAERKDAVYVGRHKLVYHNDDGTLELFDLEDDPKEQKNIVADPKHSELVAVLRKQIEKFRALDEQLAAPAVHYEKEVVEQLKALGYLD